MFTRALKYVGIVAVGSAVVGAAIGFGHAIATKSGDSPADKARFMAIGISEAMNTSALLFLVGAPIAVFVAYRRQRAR
jgi:hypothetical protein